MRLCFETAKKSNLKNKKELFMTIWTWARKGHFWPKEDIFRYPVWSDHIRMYYQLPIFLAKEKKFDIRTPIKRSSRQVSIQSPDAARQTIPELQSQKVPFFRRFQFEHNWLQNSHAMNARSSVRSFISSKNLSSKNEQILVTHDQLNTTSNHVLIISFPCQFN